MAVVYLYKKNLEPDLPSAPASQEIHVGQHDPLEIQEIYKFKISGRRSTQKHSVPAASICYWGMSLRMRIPVKEIHLCQKKWQACQLPCLPEGQESPDYQQGLCLPRMRYFLSEAEWRYEQIWYAFHYCCVRGYLWAIYSLFTLVSQDAIMPLRKTRNMYQISQISQVTEIVVHDLQSLNQQAF